ncbi:LegC family aminotransferase [Leptospira ilyithenensis]|uniref:LegC family aminotransferase n=1 Tax=Leptospira ilyithenensis TaxID=2484901 RepID=A0A4R9LM18_9LEPT|nr:LegC family aminotransferase [Leptospira ilyithenensis]TGN07994.1 LegC family aminotransferase [Leptospira ilyithenensis]
MFSPLIRFIRDYYKSNEFIPLHAPVFRGNEKQYVVDTIDSTFVSSVGSYVDRFEREIAKYSGSPKAVATVNGTAALHIALKLAGVQSGELVITQPLSFVATCNAITYTGAEPLFVDVDGDTLGLSPTAADIWLNENAFVGDDGLCRHKETNKIIRACLPMHTFGHPVKLSELVDVCKRWGIILIEDAAESLGSLYKGQHTGTFGLAGTLSFNGNKILTTGGGGMILTGDVLGERAKHITTTAKKAHPYEFVHDEVGYNYRMPNLNAALGCAQLEQLEQFIGQKRNLAMQYAELLKGSELAFFKEPNHCRSNYWLNVVICKDKEHRDDLLKSSNEQNVMTRPIWKLMNHLPMFAHCIKGTLHQAEWLEARVVNLPSSVRIEV